MSMNKIAAIVVGLVVFFSLLPLIIMLLAMWWGAVKEAWEMFRL